VVVVRRGREWEGARIYGGRRGLEEDHLEDEEEQ